MPDHNRIYTFGWMGLAVADGVSLGDTLGQRLQTELVNFLRRDTRERRWRSQDYAQQPSDVLSNHQIVSRWGRGFSAETGDGDGGRVVTVSIGLDKVEPSDARDAISDMNALFQPLGIKFDVKHVYSHALSDSWKWPLEMKKMLGRGTSDIYLLFTANEWASPNRGLVRGLANETVGAVLVQRGKRSETTQRLAHELGHLFGLPHTMLPGHVMYPNENEIGMTWSPGSEKHLSLNKRHVRWFSEIDSPVRFNVAIKMAPEMRRATGRIETQQSEAAASGDVWVRCGSG